MGLADLCEHLSFLLSLEVLFMRRKIALLDDWVSVPGSRDQEPVQPVAQIAESLARMGYQVDIFTCQSNREMPEVDPWQDTVRLIHVPMTLTNSPRDFSMELQKSADFMIDFCERQEKTYDLIHASFRSSGLLAAEIKSRLGIPFVITFQSPAEGTPHARETEITVIEEHLGIQDRVVWDADGIIAFSLQDRQALISRYHADPTYIIQIPDQTDVPNSYPSGWHAHAEMLAAFYEDVLAVRRVAILPQTSALLPRDREGLAWSPMEQVDRVLDTAWQRLGDTGEGLGVQIDVAANLMRECLKLGGRILVCSDEADLAIARQFCAELNERTGLPVFVLHMLSDLLCEAMHPSPQLLPAPLFESSGTLMFSHRLVE